MDAWKSRIDPSLPCWWGYGKLLGSLEDGSLPVPADLNRMLTGDINNESGHPIRFAPAESLVGQPYETHIYQTGEVSTRAANWHDLFNALVWARLPRIKVAMNTMHYREQCHLPPAIRGPVRDALTLFDESGVIIVSANPQILERLVMRDWSVFMTGTSAWRNEVRLLVTGHAILEKCLDPYKSMTAHALVLQVDEPFLKQTGDKMIRKLDTSLAQTILKNEILESTSCLSPLPLMGIPGWWAGGQQDFAFYDDPDVFRAAPADLKPAPVHVLDSADQGIFR
jgi:hypothetical protein